MALSEKGKQLERRDALISVAAGAGLAVIVLGVLLVAVPH